LADNPDAELLRLGEQLAVLERECEAMAVEGRRSYKIFLTACEQAGLGPHRNYADFASHDQWSEYHEKIRALSSDSDADEDREDHVSDLNERAYDLIEKILALKATTIAGLTVQTRAMVLDNEEYWGRFAMEHEENAPDQRRHRQFLEIMCNYLGIEPAPIRMREVVAA
jgi:hypothetical protein